MKKIIIDFETTNTNPMFAEILEFCVLFVENNKITEKIVEKIKFEKDWNKLNKSDIDALEFNNINNEEDLKKHNINSSDLNEILDIFLEKVKEFSDKKLPITGWNNACYDNIILKKILTKRNIIFEDVFHHHSRDIMCQFEPFYQRYYKDKFRFNLGQTHDFLIGGISENQFHNAEFDCIATLDIDIWIENFFENIGDIVNNVIIFGQGPQQ